LILTNRRLVLNNLHISSILKAGGAGAALAILLGLLSYIPFVGGFIALCFLCGGFLIPIVSGMGYGYLAPGEEDTATSAVGGGLSGGVGGFLLGLFTGINATVFSAISENVGEALAGGAMLTVMCVCGFGILGMVLGAIGGVIWPLIQGQMAS
jgi:hypothetical protein